MKDRLKNRGTVVAIALALLVFGAGAAYADKLDDDLVPPDITLPSANAPRTMTTRSAAAVPGRAGATSPGSSNANVPGLATQQPAGNAPGMGQPAGNGNAPGMAPQQPAGNASPAQNAPPDPNHVSMFHMPSKPDPRRPDPFAIIDTNKGIIKIRLYRQLAPNTVANFVDLAGKGFYNGLAFHRVVPGFCIQGGDPSGLGAGSYIDPKTNLMRCLPLEVCAQLRHNVAGVVAMAHGPSPDSGSCQFYITLSPQPQLDGKYAIFGGVLTGIDVAAHIVKGDKIRQITVKELK